MVNNTALTTPAPAAASPSVPYSKLAHFLVLAPSILGLLLFLPAGRLNLPFFWAFLILFALVAAAGLFRVARLHPDLLAERRRPAGPSKDRYTRTLAIFLIPAVFILCGLDVGRFQWSPLIPPALQISALVVVALTFAVWMWAMSSNPFFSTAVRIQSERGHRVISRGPYRFLRHPGYAAALLLFPAIPVALGSYWAVVLTLPVVALFIWRTSLEDRMLHASLPGYSDYARQVKSRLIPNLW